MVLTARHVEAGHDTWGTMPMLVPGFQDAHMHPVDGAIEPGWCDLTGAVTPEEYQRRIRAYVTELDAHGFQVHFQVEDFQM